MLPSRSLTVLCLGATALWSAQPPTPDPRAGQATFFKDMAETRGFSNGLPAQPAFAPDGRSVLFLRSGARDTTLRLLAMDLATGRTSEVISPESLLKGAAERLSPEEKARRERQRETHRGFTSFQCSADGRKILLPLAGRVYVVTRSDGAVLELPGQGWIDPRFSPDGRKVAAVRAGELHVIELATLKDLAVTTGASATLTHGLSEFVAQEELNRSSGYAWSPDSGQLIFEEADLAGVEELFIPDPANPANPPGTTRYPRAGRANANVRMGLVPATGGPVQWLQWDRARLPYVARFQWPEGGPLTIQVLSRDQRELVLLKAEPGTGATTALVSEKDEAWVNVDAFINDEQPGALPRWLPNGGGFLWMTERRGSTQLELHKPDGTLQPFDEILRQNRRRDRRGYSICAAGLDFLDLGALAAQITDELCGGVG